MSSASSIITGGLGPKQRIVLQGYGRRIVYLLKKLYETLTLSDRIVFSSFKVLYELLKFPEKRTYLLLKPLSQTLTLLDQISFFNKVVEVIRKRVRVRLTKKKEEVRFKEKPRD